MVYLLLNSQKGAIYFTMINTKLPSENNKKNTAKTEMSYQAGVETKLTPSQR